MARIRGNFMAGRYDKAIAAMKDTSAMVTPQVEQVVKTASVEVR
jgi:hypothetical protein